MRLRARAASVRLEYAFGERDRERQRETERDREKEREIEGEQRRSETAPDICTAIASNQQHGTKPVQSNAIDSSVVSALYRRRTGDIHYMVQGRFHTGARAVLYRYSLLLNTVIRVICRDNECSKTDK